MNIEQKPQEGHVTKTLKINNSHNVPSATLFQEVLELALEISDEFGDVNIQSTNYSREPTRGRHGTKVKLEVGFTINNE